MQVLFLYKTFFMLTSPNALHGRLKANPNLVVLVLDLAVVGLWENTDYYDLNSQAREKCLVKKKKPLILKSCCVDQQKEHLGF